MDAPMTPAERRASAARHLASFEFSAHDMHRIFVHAECVSANQPRPPIEGLDAPYRVQAIVGDQPCDPYGELVAVYKGRVILAWPR